MSRPRTMVIVGAGLAGAKAATMPFVHEDFPEEHAIDVRLGETVLLPATARGA